MTRVYCDHNATSPLRDVARAAMLTAFEAGGNASSVHAEGRAARRMVEEARETIALGLSVVSGGITFTGGATEAAATVLRPFGSFQRLILGATEHVAVREGHGFTPDAVTTIGVD
ncbi:MAG: aminotransferase class V-fold PLP-dependent enzyme, partial [Alphaproteobacteria bacterium]